MSKRSKAWRASQDLRDAEKSYSIKKAIQLVKKSAKANFNESVDIAVNLGVDPRHADQMVRGVCDLPGGTGRKVRLAVFAKGDKAKEAKEAGADLVGAEDLIDTVQGGKIEFDKCLATPDMMSMVAKLGKVLGPHGLMPNPKVGTVTQDIAARVKAMKSGAVEFRCEKAGIVQACVGRSSFEEAQLVGNVQAFMKALQKAKPSGVKGTYVKRVVLSSTMSPSVNVDLGALSDK